MSRPPTFPKCQQTRESDPGGWRKSGWGRGKARTRTMIVVTLWKDLDLIINDGGVGQMPYFISYWQNGQGALAIPC